MKNVKLSLVLIVVALMVAAVGSAALASISLDRTVEAGQVLTDIDPNAAIVFTADAAYSTVIDSATKANGEVILDLNGAISNTLTEGYNTEATFAIGTSAAPVFYITNNSDAPVAVNLSGANGGLSLVNPGTVPAGGKVGFYFAIDTHGVAAGSSIGGTLTVR